MAMVFFFLAETSKSWSFFSWFFPKFPKSSSSSCPYAQSHGLLLLGFFQSSQRYYLQIGFSQSSIAMVFLCCFWLLVNMPIVLFNSLIICSSPPYPHVFCSNN
jgi:hypothetical protein